MRRLLILAGLLLSASVAAPSADAADPSRIGLSATSTGVRRYTLGEWASVAVHAANRTDAEARGTLVVYFEQETQHQYARQLWLPPHSQRVTWLPVLAPKKLADEKKNIDMVMLPIVESATGEVIERRAGEEIVASLPLLVDRELIKTAAIFRLAPQTGTAELQPDPDEDVYQLMAEAREDTQKSRVIMAFPDDFAPPHPVMWQSLDQFILCGDRVTEDSAGLAALRDWLFRGGRLCIFLDRTKLETVAAILGHATSIQVIDRVELDEFTIEDLTETNPNLPPDRRRLEEPAEFVRVVADDMEVHCRINGWPAAFWRKAGRGVVVFVTLSPNGWRPTPIPPGSESLPENTEPAFRTKSAVRSWTSRFYDRAAEDRIPERQLQPILEEQIGYHIPTRTIATSLLGLNGVALVLGGYWLVRRNQLEWLAFLLPLFAGATSLTFLWIGFTNNQSVPPAVAFAQLVQFAPETDRVRVSGVAAMYQQSTGSLRVTSGPNGLFLPKSEPAEGSSHRLLWSDSDRGSWLNVSLPAGSVRYASFDQSVQLTEHIAATGQFRQEGLVGQLPISALTTTDAAVIASLPAPNSAVRIAPDGTFRASVQDRLPAGQFLATNVVSDESRRRQEIYRHILVARDDANIAPVPTLFAWLKPQPDVLSIPSELVQYGTALGAIPLQIERTPPGTEFSVPATFLRTESVRGTRGVSLAYSVRRGTWISDSSRATNTRLRFVLPRQVLPCQLTEAQLTIKLNAPSRALQVLGVLNAGVKDAAGAGKEELIRQIDNPSGVYEVTVTRPEWLAQDEGGGILFGIVITASEQERQQEQSSSVAPPTEPAPPPVGGNGPPSTDNLQGSFTSWIIDYVRLDVRGKTL